MKKCHIASTASAALSELQQAVLLWWEGKRPQGWQIADHLGTPAVNTSNPAEEKLARAVAAAVGCGAL